MLKYVEGCILDAYEKGEIDILCHQVNCVTENYTEVTQKIFEKHPSTIPRKKKFGTWEINKVGEGIIVNIYSQYFAGEPSYRTIGYRNYYDTLEVRNITLAYILTHIRKKYKGKIGIPVFDSLNKFKENHAIFLEGLEIFVYFL